MRIDTLGPDEPSRFPRGRTRRLIADDPTALHVHTFVPSSYEMIRLFACLRRDSEHL
jgi:hypothetical protein